MRCWLSLEKILNDSDFRRRIHSGLQLITNITYPKMACGSRIKKHFYDAKQATYSKQISLNAMLIFISSYN